MAGNVYTGSINNAAAEVTISISPDDITPDIPITFTAFPSSGLDIQFEPIANVANFPQGAIPPNEVSGFLFNSNNTIVDGPGQGGSEFVIFDPGFPAGENARIIVSSFVPPGGQRSTGSFVFEVSAEENNNSDANAEQLGQITATETLNGFVGQSDPEDWYQFVTNDGGEFTFKLSGLGDDADIEILQDNGTTLRQSNESGTTEEEETVNLQANTSYFVKVSNKSSGSTLPSNQGGPTATQYTLDITPGGSGDDTMPGGGDDTPSGGNQNTPSVSFTVPGSDDTDAGNPVPGVDEDSENTINGETFYVLTNGPDSTFPAGETNILALSGNDNITGFAAAEQYNGNRGADTINGGGGNDTMFGGRGSDELNGDDDNDRLIGNLNNDVIKGGNGNDVMFGGQGDDAISGGLGNDVLLGDRGTDFLQGDEGTDTFVLPGSAAAATTQADADVIADFEDGTDKIMMPVNVNFNSLELNSVNLQVGSGEAFASTSIELGGTFLGIVQNVTPDKLTAEDFVSFDDSAFSV